MTAPCTSEIDTATSHTSEEAIAILKQFSDKSKLRLLVSLYFSSGAHQISERIFEAITPQVLVIREGELSFTIGSAKVLEDVVDYLYRNQNNWLGFIRTEDCDGYVSLEVTE